MKFNVFGIQIQLKRPSKDVLVDNLGDFDNEKREIRIRDSLKGDEYLCCLLHELQHAIHWRTGITQAIDPTTLEIVVENTAVCLVELFEIKLRK